MQGLSSAGFLLLIPSDNVVIEVALVFNLMCHLTVKCGQHELGQVVK